MERELWRALYQLARRCAPAQPWEVVRFFRLRGSGGVLVGGAARATSQLGLRSGELASGIVAPQAPLAVDDEPSPANHGGAPSAGPDGRSFGSTRGGWLGANHRREADDREPAQQRSASDVGPRWSRLCERLQAARHLRFRTSALGLGSRPHEYQRDRSSGTSDSPLARGGRLPLGRQDVRQQRAAPLGNGSASSTAGRASSARQSSRASPSQSRPCTVPGLVRNPLRQSLVSHAPRCRTPIRIPDESCERIGATPRLGSNLASSPPLGSCQAPHPRSIRLSTPPPSDSCCIMLCQGGVRGGLCATFPISREE